MNVGHKESQALSHTLLVYSDRLLVIHLFMLVSTCASMSITYSSSVEFLILYGLLNFKNVLSFNITAFNFNYIFWNPL